MFKRIILIATLFFASALAFADLPRPSEVKAAFESGNYTLAEELLKRVMVERPTAKVHYQLGQVYTAQGKHADALNEYRQAQALDPSLKFASSASTFMSALADAQALVAPPPAPAPIESRVPETTVNTSAHSSSDNGTGFFLVFFGTLVLIVAIYGIFYWLSTVRAKKAEQKRIEEETDKKITELLDMSKQVDDAVLIAKTSIYSNTDKEYITKQLTSLQSQIRSMIANLKDGSEDVSFYRVHSMKTSLREATSYARNGLPKVPPTVYNEPSMPSRQESRTAPKHTPPKAPPAPPAPPARKIKEDKPAPSKPANSTTRTSATSTRTTSIRNDVRTQTTESRKEYSDDAADLLTGVLLGSILSSSSSNDRDDDTPSRSSSRSSSRMDSRNDDNDSYTSRSSSFDGGRDNDRDSYTHSPSSFDGGTSSSNDNY